MYINEVPNHLTIRPKETNKDRSESHKRILLGIINSG